MLASKRNLCVVEILIFFRNATFSLIYCFIDSLLEIDGYFTFVITNNPLLIIAEASTLFLTVNEYSYRIDIRDEKDDIRIREYLSEKILIAFFSYMKKTLIVWAQSDLNTKIII